MTELTYEDHQVNESRIRWARLSEAERAQLRLLVDLDNLNGRMDYPFFVTEVLGHDFPEIWDPRVQEHLQRVGRLFKDWVLTRHTQKKFRKIMDIRPRGTCKSAGVSIPLPTYAHLWDTEIAGAVMSASYEKIALKFSAAIRQVWNGESPDSRLVDLYGPFEPANKRNRPWSVDKMVTERRRSLTHADPTLAAYSVAQGPTSGHFKLFIVDDPVTEEMMERDANFLDKVWGAYNRLPFVLDNDALLYLIMTRYDDADLIGRIIDQEIKPAVQDARGTEEMPDDWDDDRGWIKYAHLAGWEVFYDSVYENYNPETRSGDIVYKTIWPEERIEDVRKTPRGERLFWPQLMNQPASREDAPIKRHHIDKLWIDTVNDVPAEALRTIDLHCDFSFKSAEAFMKQTGDWGVVHVCAKHGGYVYRIGGFRGKLTQEKFGEQIMKLVSWIYYGLNSKVRYVTYEQSMGHGSGDESTRLWLHQCQMSNPDLPRFTPYPIRRMKQGNKTKLQRIMDQNWAWQEGYVVLVREADFNDPLIHQMLRQGYTEHDDDADAFADAFHEDLYKKTRPTDLPDDVAKWIPGAGSDKWRPLPAVHGHVGRNGRFTPERRTARNPGAARGTRLDRLMRRN